MNNTRMSRERDTQNWNSERSLQKKPMLIRVSVSICSCFHYILHQLFVVFFHLLHHLYAFHFHPFQSYLPHYPPPRHDPSRSLPPKSCHCHFSSPPKLNPMAPQFFLMIPIAFSHYNFQFLCN